MWHYDGKKHQNDHMESVFILSGDHSITNFYLRPADQLN